MKVAKVTIVNFFILVLSLVGFGLSFLNIYSITITGSVIDLAGEFCRSTEETKNSLFSAFCMLLPLASVIVNEKWMAVLAIIVSVVNALTIALLYPFVIAARGIIGSTYSAELTTLGLVVTIVVLLIVILLFFKACYLGRIKRAERGA